MSICTKIENGVKSAASTAYDVVERSPVQAVALATCPLGYAAWRGARAAIRSLGAREGTESVDQSRAHLRAVQAAE